jgi:uncharacterized protein YyaL (SSP411 family)
MRQILFFFLIWHVAWAEYTYTNALIQESSPYLQQHAHNPVNWYPWGKEALEKAQKENKLIFLSIGYSTCHWCHVMEEESFTDEAVAKLLNDHYISIKVDREEYPQIDKKYQQRYMAVFGKRGGWPLSVFLSPEGKPFHVTTYIPKVEGYGSDGMMKMLPSFVKMQQKNPELFQQEIAKYARSVNKKIKKSKLKTIDRMNRFMQEVEKEFDASNGGFAKRPKFPEASKMALLLDIYQLYDNNKALTMVELTAKKMAKGGIYDQIGGGFFRYTTDVAWQIPHFEKMLYTNAELIPVYVRLYAMTKDPLYKKVVDETIAQVEKHFMKEGVYLSASDADSDGEEGGYFIYSYEKVFEGLLKKGLKKKQIQAVLDYLGIEEDGNIDVEFSHAHITQEQEPEKLEEVRSYLRVLRQSRTFPFVDNKIITAWNAMMIKALFAVSQIDECYMVLAKKRLNVLLKLMRTKEVLYHQAVVGKKPKQKGLLEDYAFLIDALIEGYIRTYDLEYLLEIKYLTKEALLKFYRNKVWYLSDDGIEALADFDDRYYTSALSVMLENLIRVASLTEELDYYEVVKETIKNTDSIEEKMLTSTSKWVDVLLRINKGDVIIKSSLQNLTKAKKEIEIFNYPFILSKTEESNKYLACRINSCFAYDENISKLLRKMESVLDGKREP